MQQAEKDRLDLRQEFERLFTNKRLAQIALDAMPPIDYAQLATRSDLDGTADRLDARMDRLDARMDRLDAKIDKVDAKIDKVDAKIDKVDAKMERQIAELTRSMYFGFLALFGALSGVISIAV